MKNLVLFLIPCFITLHLTAQKDVLKISIADKAYTPQQLNRTIAALKQRLLRKGLDTAVSFEKGKIIITSTGKISADFIRDTLLKRSSIDCYSLYSLSNMGSAFQTAEKMISSYLKRKEYRQLYKEVQKRCPANEPVLWSLIQFKTPVSSRFVNPELGDVMASDTALLRKLLLLAAKKFPADCRFYFGWPPVSTFKKDSAARFSFYAAFTTGGFALGNFISTAKAVKEQYGYWSLKITLNEAGRKGWENITSKNIGLPLAIIYNDVVYSAPTVQGVMSTGETQITGTFTKEDADKMANVLGSGYLPLQLKVISEETLK